jgi:hypothetical protein
VGERLWKKIIGKPYSGKPNVRFDEAELEIELAATTQALYSTVIRTPYLLSSFLKSIFDRLLQKRQISSRNQVLTVRGGNSNGNRRIAEGFRCYHPSHDLLGLM